MYLRYQQINRLIALLAPASLVEVGTWSGDRALLMAAEALRRRGHVHYWGFDLFEAATAETDAAEMNAKSHRSLAEVEAKLAAFAAGNPGFSYDLIQGDTRATLPASADLTWTDPADGRVHRLAEADFAYIDGGHSVATIASDHAALAACQAVVFDDYYLADAAGRRPDVARFGCNATVDALAHVLLPAADRLDTGGRIRLAAAGDAVMAAAAPRATLNGQRCARKTEVVTTFSDEFYLAHGRRFVEGFERFWPADVGLTVYYDTLAPETRSAGERVTARPFAATVPELVAFKAKYGGDPTANGRTAEQEADYRFNAVKFCHKVFALTHAALASGSERLIWLDADTLTFAPVPPDFIDALLPEGDYVSYLGRDGTHSECGCMAFDLAHPVNADFMTFFRDIYAEGHVFELPEWHDSYVFDVVRDYFARQGRLSAHDLAAGGAGATRHPFVNSALGAYMDHLISPGRKQAGCSFAGDLAQPRDEFYWRVVPFVPDKLLGRG